MKKHQIISLLLMLGMASCSFSPKIVKRLNSKGISDQNTVKIIVKGSEGNMGKVQAIVPETFAIQEIWDKLYQARPTDLWPMSGYFVLEFYDSKDSREPKARLLINENDAAHFEGDPRKRYRCPGLEKYLFLILKAEQKKKRR